MTGISSGVVTTTTPVIVRVAEDVEHPVGLVADEPDLDQIADHLRRTDLGDDVAGRLGVDHDEVVVRSRTSWHSLPTPRISLTPGAASATKSNVRASGPMLAEQRHLHEQPEVLAERVLGVHRHRQQVRFDLPGLELQRRSVEGVGERALGVHLAHERAAAGAGREMGERRRDGGLADTSLAGDEHQPAIEERRVHRRQVSPRSRCGDRHRACRARCRRSSPTAPRPAGRACR